MIAEVLPACRPSARGLRRRECAAGGWQHAVLFCQGDQIVPENLPQEIQESRSAGPRHDRPEIELFDMPMREIERIAIERALVRTGGNIKMASEILDLHRQTLYRKMKIYNMSTNTGKRTVRRAGGVVVTLQPQLR